ncbi:MAG: heme-binding protein [Pseudomonadota bacterium]
MKKKWIVMILILGILVAGITLWGPIVSDVEQPKYQIISTNKNIEVRQYEPMIIAQVIVNGDRKSAISDGFRVLADYIFGNNNMSEKIAMTAPVTQQNQKISMTAPVGQQRQGDSWTVYFVMPAKFTLDTLPIPANNKIQLIEIPAKEFAVIQFSGRATENDLTLYEDQLKDYILKEALNTISEPIYAFYNPPWTLPILRRNEVMIELAM